MKQTGLVGRAILASRSPWLHEEEARAQGMELAYRLFDFDALGYPDGRLQAQLRELAGAGFAGVNITYPFKQAVVPLLDELADCAAAVGAVNTVAMSEGRLIGFNTDKSGFQDSLTEALGGVAMDRVLQLGAGGAGAAVANALLASGTGRLEVSDLDQAKACELAERLSARYGNGRVAVQAATHFDTRHISGIVNTTPMGMVRCPGMAISEDLIEARHWVADVVYFPLETELLQVARAKGCKTLNGRGMAVYQAAAAFDIFTGSRSDRTRMLASFDSFAVEKASRGA